VDAILPRAGAPRRPLAVARIQPINDIHPGNDFTERRKTEFIELRVVAIINEQLRRTRAWSRIGEGKPAASITSRDCIVGDPGRSQLSHKTIDDPEEPHPVKKPRDDQLMQPISPYWSELAANLDRE
jgi:hypothetical protein